MIKRSLYLTVFCFTGLTATATATATASDNLDELMSMSLEELSMLDVKVETASKFSQKLSDIPASVYVLDGERIERSGVRTIAEALALVPGLYVTKYTDTEFFVSARGFHDGLYNKMLVLMDGRSLFSPVYGGVYWSDIDYVLSDIERIEVLRGPGGSMWGGNAVNGVINIITKSTLETLGTHASVTYAKYGDYSAEVRHGLHINQSVSGRAFYKKKRNHPYPGSNEQIRTQEFAGIVFSNNDLENSWEFRVGGERSSFYIDTAVELYDNFGDWYDFYIREDKVESSSFFTQWSLSKFYDDDLTVNYGLWLETNKEDASDAPGTYNIFDGEVSVFYRQSDRIQWTFGGGYRFVETEFPYLWEDIDFNEVDSFIRVSNTDRELDSIINVFSQNDFLVTDKFKTVLGAKLEYFESVDSIEFSPQIRVIYSVDLQNSAWVGWGRSAVAPSYMDQYTTFLTNDFINVGTPETPVFEYKVVGYGASKNLHIERVTTFDFGYRYQSELFEVDVTFFQSHHENVRGNSQFPSTTQYPSVYIFGLNDEYEVNTRGIELASLYEFSETATLYASYTYLTAEQEFVGQDEADNGTESLQQVDYQHLLVLQGLWQINSQWQLDLVVKGQRLKYSDEYNSNWDDDQLPNYLALDARLAWQYSEKYPQIEFIGQNIGEHKGYYSDSYQLTNSGYINEQIVYLRLTHEF